MPKEIPDPVFDLLCEKFIILDHLSFLEFDSDFETLRSRLSNCHKNVYGVTERILIEHMDTDYYFSESSVGINLRNFFIVLQELDIPNSVIIFYTNHIGLKNEIDILCKNFHHADRPLVIESFLGKAHHDPEKIKILSLDVEKIQYHALCMIHLTRSHRHAVYRAIESIDESKLIKSATLPTTDTDVHYSENSTFY